MDKILISIKPKYVEKIFDCSKIFEYRKQRCKSNIKKMVIYSTAPISRIVGEVEVDEVIENDPIVLWNFTNNKSGISYENYKKYFNGYKKAYAYRLKNPLIYNMKISLHDIGMKMPPQSFLYLSDEIYSKINEKSF